MSIFDGRVCQRGKLNFTSSCMKSWVQVTWVSRKRGSVEKMSSILFNIMIQRTASENAACLRKVCKRSDQPKIDRVVNNDARLILRRKLNLLTRQPADYFIACYTVLTRPIKVETAVHGCDSWLSVWTISCRCPVKLSASHQPCIIVCYFFQFTLLLGLNIFNWWPLVR